MNELEGQVAVVKVKAHCNYQSVIDGRISWRAWTGNGIADMWAKRGCAEASRMSPCEWVHKEWRYACSLYRWAIHIAAEWMNDTKPTDEPTTHGAPDRHVAAPPAAQCPRRKGKNQHEVWRNTTHEWCRLCGLSGPWSQGKRTATLARSCKGTMGNRCGIHGRERAISPRPHSYDDGCIPIAVLRTHGAERVFTHMQEEDQSAAAEATGRATQLDARETSGRPRQEGHNDEAAVPQLSRAYEEEDPFEHGPLDMDNAMPATERDVSASTQAHATEGTSTAESKVAHPSHSLRRTGHIVWCSLCGRHAAHRLGVGLLSSCRGEAIGSYPSRIARLKVGKHPMTKDDIT